jgi:hypothetical protein
VKKPQATARESRLSLFGSCVSQELVASTRTTAKTPIVRFLTMLL